MMSSKAQCKLRVASSLSNVQIHQSGCKCTHSAEALCLNTSLPMQAAGTTKTLQLSWTKFQPLNIQLMAPSSSHIGAQGARQLYKALAANPECQHS